MHFKCCPLTSLMSTKSSDICAFSIEKKDFFVFSKLPLKYVFLHGFFGVFSQISIQTFLKYSFFEKKSIRAFDWCMNGHGWMKKKYRVFFS